jgi:hypothetical protein
MLIVALLAAAAVAHGIANLLLSRDDRAREHGLRQSLQIWAQRLLPLAPLVVVGGLVELLYRVLQTAPFYRFRPTVQTQHTLVVGLEMLAVAFVLNQTLTFFRLRWLAERLGCARLAEHAGIVAVGLGSSLLLLASVALPAMAMIHEASIWFVLLVVLPWALVVLFTVWSVILLMWICPLFFQSARHARQKWSAADLARASTVPTVAA